MKIKIKVADKEFELKSELKERGVKFLFADEKDEMLHNKFTISVSIILEDKQKITRRFYFFDSQANYEEGKEDLDEESLKWAFRCVIEDGLSATESFEDFASGLGYSTDSIKANKIYKECQKSLKKLLDLNILESELSDILEELSKKGVE
jgi:hypothetical protein